MFNALCPKRTGGVFVSQKARQGTIFCFLAAVLYSIGGLCIKVIPWNGIAINGARNMVALVVVGGFLLLNRHALRWNRWVLLGAISVCGTNVLFSLANKMTTAANTIVLQFTAPIFVILLGILFWKRRPSRLDVAACVFVLFGVACFFIDSIEAGNGAGNMVALLAGLAYAGVFLLNDLPDSDPISSVFWGELFSVLIGVPFLLQETVFTPTVIISVVILGAFQVGLAYVLLTIGLKTTPPVTAALVSGIEPVLNPILVAVFYHETIGHMAMIGAVIVVISVLAYNAIRAKQTKYHTC